MDLAEKPSSLIHAKSGSKLAHHLAIVAIVYDASRRSQFLHLALSFLEFADHFNCTVFVQPVWSSQSPFFCHDLLLLFVKHVFQSHYFSAKHVSHSLYVSAKRVSFPSFHLSRRLFIYLYLVCCLR